MLEVVLVVLLVVFVFGIPIRGSVPLLFALCALFLLTTLGLGLFISTVSRTQQQAMMSSIFFVMLPMMLLSGFVFPIENMPPAIQAVTYLIPLRYFFVILRGIFLKGVGMEVLWDETLALAVFGVVVLGLSIARFRKRIA
jgi:ABC-2 type transport system permease protein